MLKIDEIVWQLVASIPKGKVMTYGQIANQAGFKNYARHVGTTLKKLPMDSLLPWHRVVNAKGELSFPIGSPSYEKQKLLLESEGIKFIGTKLSLADYRWGVN